MRYEFPSEFPDAGTSSGYLQAELDRLNPPERDRGDALGALTWLGDLFWLGVLVAASIAVGVCVTVLLT